MLCKRLVVILVFMSFLLVLVSCAPRYDAKSIQRAQEAGIPIIMTEIYPYYPNSVGGVDVRLRFVNTSNYDFKYVTFTLVPYNRVGDIAPSDIGNKTDAYLRLVGPIKSDGGVHGTTWETVWYNGTISCVKLVEIEITYMSGRVENLRDYELSKVFSKTTGNYICRNY